MISNKQSMNAHFKMLILSNKKQIVSIFDQNKSNLHPITILQWSAFISLEKKNRKIK